MSKHVILPFALTKHARRALLRNSRSAIYHSNRRPSQHLGCFSFSANVSANVASYVTRQQVTEEWLNATWNNRPQQRNVTRNVANNRLIYV